MRTKQEINRAIAVLNHKTDRLSLVMAEVLQARMTEQQVFEKYVLHISEPDRDEAVFFAARDAARFSAGHIGLEELIPDVQTMTAADFNMVGALGVVDEESDTMLLSRKEFNKLLARIEQLEEKIERLCKQRSREIAYKQTPSADKDDFIIQDAACKYIGCSKVTIHSWTRKGLVKGYRKGAHVYYSKSELDANPTVLNFRKLK